MSNYMAIATVTAALKDLLQTAAQTSAPHVVNDAEVITMRPDDAAKETGSKINIYLYQVTPNAAWRNADVPTRRADGTLLQRPLVALDLHYMISFYGNEGSLVPQLLLGIVARALHVEPQLTRERIRKALPSITLDGASILLASDLADQIELVKFSPLHLSLEELSKIWSVFYQIPYALSVAYQGSVVLIESDDTPTSALPVRKRNLYAITLRQPIIEQIVALAKDKRDSSVNDPITADKTLFIKGHRLRGDNSTIIQINGFEVIPQNVSDTEITLSLKETTVRVNGADVSLADLLQAGVQGLQIIHRRQMGEDKDNDQVNWHRGVESNVAAFVLRPKIIDASGKVVDQVKVTLIPPVARGQRIVLLLNELIPPPRLPGSPAPAAYSFNADPDKQTWRKNQMGKDVSNTITFTIPNVKAKTSYLIRVQVGGAESALDVDTDTKSPTFSMYTGTPKVDIP